ncbi:MAG TPA: hypothetical protein VMV31_13570, partial [Terriglobales bacterium]|nr:hypothetical protein [Terriglobales bacterium]
MLGLGAAALAQGIPSVGDTTAPPPNLPGHALIAGPHEVVNPANGSVALTFPVAMPPGRQWTLPFSFFYSSNGQRFAGVAPLCLPAKSARKAAKFRRAARPRGTNSARPQRRAAPAWGHGAPKSARAQAGRAPQARWGPRPPNVSNAGPGNIVWNTQSGALAENGWSYGIPRLSISRADNVAPNGSLGP